MASVCTALTLVFLWIAFASAMGRKPGSKPETEGPETETQAPIHRFGNRTTDVGVPGTQNTVGNTPLTGTDRGTAGVDNTGTGTTGIGPSAPASGAPPGGGTGTQGGTGASQ